MESSLTFNYKNCDAFNAYICDSFNSLPDKIGTLFPSVNKLGIIVDDSINKKTIEGIKSLLSNKYEIIEAIFEVNEAVSLSEIAQKSIDIFKNSVIDDSCLILAIGGKEIIEIASLVSSASTNKICYVCVPMTFDSIVKDSVYGEFETKKCANNKILSYVPSLVYINTAIVTELEHKEFTDVVAKVLGYALVRDGAFYEWLIMNFAEIMDRDLEAINEFIFKTLSIMQFFVAKDPWKNKECVLLDYGKTLANPLKDRFEFLSDGAALSLGIIATSYISYKRQMLSWEEFYEIRDMFVPFDLPISLDPFDANEVIDKLEAECKKADSNSYVLLKKIGRAVLTTDISLSEIKDAISSLGVEWE